MITVIGVWYWGVPDDYVSEKIESIAGDPVSITVEGFSKKPLFTFDVEKILVRKDAEEVWMINGLAGDVAPLQLLKGQAVIHIRGESYGGRLTGHVSTGRNGQKLQIDFHAIKTSEITYLRSVGFDGRGLLSGTLSYDDGSGRLEFILDDAVLNGFSGYGIFVPLEFFHTIRGAIDLESPNSFVIKSIALTGKGIYIRIKGKVVNGFADLEVEVMPEASFPGNSLLMMIERYKISDGYYYIPFKRHL